MTTTSQRLRCPHCGGRLTAEAQHIQFVGDCDHDWVGWGCEGCGAEWDVNGDQTTSQASPAAFAATVGAGGGSS